MTTINDLLAAMPDPLAEIELHRQLAREAYKTQREQAGTRDARRAHGDGGAVGPDCSASSPRRHRAR